MPKTETENKAKPQDTIPVSAVPHLYNERMLQWQASQFNALKSIYDKLDEVLKVLKEK
ncbi:MAG: hypothetical protein ACYTAO_21505 [Planctomycetota bacterium]|jgi:hypothetical protein